MASIREAPRAEDNKLTKCKRQVKSREPDCGVLEILRESLCDLFPLTLNFHFCKIGLLQCLTADNACQVPSLKPDIQNILKKYKLVLLLKSLVH